MAGKGKSKRKRGATAEKIAKEYLESQGWLVHRAVPQLVQPRPGTFFVLTHDVWGVIDLAGMHPQHGFLFVQVTSAKYEGGTRGLLANVRTRRRKVEALPWPTWDWVDEGGDVRTIYRVQVWALRNVQRGRLVSRYFQVWDYDVEGRAWTLLPERIHVSGPPPSAGRQPG